MIAVLDMDNIQCDCPDINETRVGSLWSITGTEPMGSTVCLNDESVISNIYSPRNNYKNNC
jgi:hypothetical protein